MTSASKHETRVDGSIVERKTKIQGTTILHTFYDSKQHLYQTCPFFIELSKEFRGKELTFYLIRFN